MSARDDVIQAFNDSAAMEGNEPHFIETLARYREEIIEEVASWLEGAAPIAAKWIRQDFKEEVK